MRGRGEALAGGLLILWTLLAAVVVWRMPGPNALDRRGFSLIAASLHSSTLLRVADLGSLAVLVAGSVLAALVVVGRDRRTALVCLCGPAAAALVVDWVLKPVVGRHYLGVLSFPSGTVTVTAAVATAWAVAVPGRWKWPVVAIGAVATVAVAVAVIALRWHYPSDALAGAAFGVGVVLAADGAVHLWGAGGAAPAARAAQAVPTAHRQQ